MDSLPVEVLTHIAQFLPLADQLEFALVSKKFYDAFLDPKILKNIQLSANNCTLSHFLSVFSSGERIFRLKIGSNVEVSGDLPNLESLKGVKELVLESPEAAFLVNFMPNLRNLAIRNAGTKAIKLNTNQPLKHVQELSISQNFEQFEELLGLLPSLARLHLEGFTSKTQGFNRNSCLSLKTLQKCVERLRLQGICLKSYSCDLSDNEKYIRSLIFQNLRDLALKIDGIDPLHVIRLLKSQELLVLDLACWNGFDPDIFKAVSEMSSLRSLTLRGKLHTAGLDFSCLRQLRILRFRDTFDFEESDSHLLSKLKDLRDLEIDSRCLNKQNCTSCVVKLASQNPNLTVLNLTKSQICDENLKIVLERCQKLRKLFLNDCRQISTLPSLEVGSLEVLTIDNCFNLRHFPEGLLLTNLREVSLNHSSAVDRTFIEHLTRSSTLIETLHLNVCDNLDDGSVEMLATRLPRLRVLDISWCKRLTKLAEYALWKSRALRHLHAQGMERLSMSVILLFARISSLQVFRSEKVYTRMEFEARKYSTTCSQRKLQNARARLVFINSYLK